MEYFSLIVLVGFKKKKKKENNVIVWLSVMVNRVAKGSAEQLAEETAEDKQTPRLPQLTGQKKTEKTN